MWCDDGVSNDDDDNENNGYNDTGDIKATPAKCDIFSILFKSRSEK